MATIISRTSLQYQENKSAEFQFNPLIIIVSGVDHIHYYTPQPWRTHVHTDGQVQNNMPSICLAVARGIKMDNVVKCTSGTGEQCGTIVQEFSRPQRSSERGRRPDDPHWSLWHYPLGNVTLRISKLPQERKVSPGATTAGPSALGWYP